MTETEQRRRIRGITVYDVAQRCLPLSSQPSNSAEFLLHTAAQRMSVTQLIGRQTCIFQTHHHRALTADPWPTSDFWTETKCTGSLNSRPGSMSSIFSIFVIFLHIALKIWHKLFVLFRLSKMWKKSEFSILPIFENFFLFFAYFAINRKRGRLTQKSFCISCWKSLTLLLT